MTDTTLPDYLTPALQQLDTARAYRQAHHNVLSQYAGKARKQCL
ncbi:hypothetical protein Q0A17_14770 [Citrobacter sp. S2-9]|uniref:Uncharacterized protein n=1 Tax=Citrobacter enshiensis TaxID=2971264 RepID=A0ABT8PWA3_9ENTR|nr:hypothetical protein [Citrobacter enshiensis]MDN8600659.1 hypothetical protein [Citrobacter enshiensis]